MILGHAAQVSVRGRPIYLSYRTKLEVRMYTNLTDIKNEYNIECNNFFQVNLIFIETIYDFFGQNNYENVNLKKSNHNDIFSQRPF